MDGTLKMMIGLLLVTPFIIFVVITIGKMLYGYKPPFIVIFLTVVIISGAISGYKKAFKGIKQNEGKVEDKKGKEE